MLLINQGTTNSLILTLTENVTIDSPYYLFEFTNDVTMRSEYYILEDISIHPERYNEFLIDARISPAGQWTYRVFQQYDPHNTDPNLTEGLLEIGIAKVVPLAITTYYENNNLDNTFYVNE